MRLIYRVLGSILATTMFSTGLVMQKILPASAAEAKVVPCTPSSPQTGYIKNYLGLNVYSFDKTLKTGDAWAMVCVSNGSNVVFHYTRATETWTRFKTHGDFAIAKSATGVVHLFGLNTNGLIYMYRGNEGTYVTYVSAPKARSFLGVASWGRISFLAAYKTSDGTSSAVGLIDP